MGRERLDSLRLLLAEQTTPAGQPLDGLLVTGAANRFYVTGFTGSSGYVLVTPSAAVLLTDFRYTEQGQAQSPGFEVVRHGSPWHVVLRERLAASEVACLGFDSEQLSVAEHGTLSAALEGVALIGLRGLVERLRQVKEPSEVAAIESAVACADRAFAHLLEDGVLRPGVRESEVAAELEYRMRREGATGFAFETIVASGPRSSLPHGRASDRLLAGGDFVTLDFGAQVDGYCSDITRTVVVGRASPEQKDIYDLVLRAQLAGVDAVQPGRAGSEVDAAAREIIARAGHGEHFGHGLGHGVGIVVHEAPRLAPAVEAKLEPGMVTSVEPGVYVPGWGGVRIEDLVLVTGDGCRVLTGSPKELLELG